MLFDDNRLNSDREIPLSFSQKRIWFLQNLYNDHVMYNTLRCFRINGFLDMDALQMTLQTLAVRHDVLRSRLHLSPDGSPFQVMDMEPHINIEYTDLRNSSRDDIRGLAEQIVQEAVVRPFKLYDENLFRVVVVMTDKSESMLLFVMHHLIADFSAWCLFLTEFAAVYAAKMTGRHPSLPALAWPYGDFAKNQALLLTEENITNQRKYWRDFFAEGSNPRQAACLLSQPVARAAPPSYASISQFIPSATIRACEIIAESRKCTLFTIYMAAIALLVSCLYRDSKVTLCTANANRRDPGAKQVIGCFFTNVIFSLDLRPDCKMSDLLHDVRKKFSDARQHQEMPFEMFAEDLALECTRQGRPPYRIYISYHNAADDDTFNLPDARLERVMFSTGRNTHEDIVFDFWEKLSDGKLCLELRWLWRTDVFDQKTIQKASTLFETLLSEIGKDLHDTVKGLQDSLAGPDDFRFVQRKIS